MLQPPDRRNQIEAVAVAAVLLLLALLLVASKVLYRWDLRLYDLELRLFHRTAPAEVVIVAIDEESIASIGRWPWPRRIHATMLDRLGQAKAKAVGFDVLFDQSDPADPAGDENFGEAIRRHGAVVLATAPVPARDGGVRAALPVPVLQHAYLGHVDAELDEDGIVRQVYLNAGIASASWPTFGLAVFELGRGVIRNAALPASGVSIPHASATWVRADPFLVPFFGAPGRFAQVSFARLLSGDPEAIEKVRDRYVLIGATAVGIASGFATPASGQHQAMPGVELNANVLGSLLDGVVLQPLHVVGAWLFTAFFAVVPVVLYPRARHWALAVYVGWLALILLCGVALLLLAHRWFAPSAALVAAAASYPLWSWRRLEASMAELTLERNLAHATLHSIGDAVVTTDKEGRIDYLNPTAEALTGVSLEFARGRPLQEVVQTFDQSGERVVPPPVEECLREGKSVQASQYLLLKGALDERTISWTANPIRDGEGQVQGLVLAFSDVTQVLSLTREMVRQATHDGLTDLPNRVLLEDRLATALPRALRAEEQVAVMFIDLDGFKKINDGLGHAAGDVLLKDVARRLKASCREEDSVARWGGDEFVVVLERLRSRDVAASRASQLIQSLAQPFALADQEVSVTISIGISFFPKDGKDVGTLLKRADAAMYRAKEEGRNCFRFYSARMSTRSRERLAVEKSLRDALNNGEFCLYYQPQIDLATGRIRGLEALLRWNHPQALLTPAHFLGIAEQSQLIHLLGEWALRHASVQLAELQRRGIREVNIAANLSPRQLAKRDLYNRISAILEDTKADASQLTLEISEELLLREPNELAPVLRSLRELGVRIAIDDFGTGHSSIGYLKRLPIDQLKIDQTFVRDAAINAKDAALVQGMVTLARSLNMEVVAEGVETETQLALVRRLDCDAAQGFYLAPPKPIESLWPQLLRQAAGVETSDDQGDFATSPGEKGRR